jgi:membrane-associated HD superfamily phosphohydrolase
MPEYPAKAKISNENGTIEIEGSENFVKEQLQYFENKTKKDLIEDNKFEILKMKYETHADDLQFRKNFSFKLCYSFMVLILVLCAWLTGTFKDGSIPVLKESEKFVLMTVLLMLSVATCWTFHRDYRRRKDVVKTLQNIAKVLKFDNEQAYSGIRIDPESTFEKIKYRDITYILVIIAVTMLPLLIILRR